MMKLLTWLGVASEPAQPLDQLDLFLAGHSIPAIAGGGQNMIAEQRKIEQKIRAYILQLEAEIAELTNVTR